MFEAGDLVKFKSGNIKHVREGVVIKVRKTPDDFIDAESNHLVEVLWIDHQHMTQRYYDCNLSLIARANK